MPIQLPDLDDRTYADLVQEALGLIPTYAPEWTNYNPSDPGITLIELFAWLTEMLLYRLDRVTDDSLLAFVRLLNGPDWAAPDPPTQEAVTAAIREAVIALRTPNRAVTADDFERLALQAVAGKVARTRCLPRRDLSSGNAQAGITDAPGHISVVIVPPRTAKADNLPQPDGDLLRGVADDLEPRRLLTTRVHVVGPSYVTLRVRLTLVLAPDAVEDRFLFSLAPMLQADLDRREASTELVQNFARAGVAISSAATIAIMTPQTSWLITDTASSRATIVRKEADPLGNQAQLNVYADVGRAEAVGALRQYLDPLVGGTQGQGWPFGRNVYVSDIYELLDGLPGVDYVTPTLDAESGKPLDELIVRDASRLRRNADGGLIAAALQAHELVDARIAPGDLTLAAAGKSA